MRTVQLTLTLEVEVEASYGDEGWEADDVGKVYVNSMPVNTDSIETFLLTHPGVCQELADLYAQQEP